MKKSLSNEKKLITDLIHKSILAMKKQSWKSEVCLDNVKQTRLQRVINRFLVDYANNSITVYNKVYFTNNETSHISIGTMPLVFDGDTSTAKSDNTWVTVRSCLAILQSLA